MYKIIFTLASFVLSLITNPAIAASNNNSSPYYKNSVGVSYGTGKPKSLSGFRLNYRNTFAHYQQFAFGLETSYARWNVIYDTNKKLEVFSLAPVVRINICPLGKEHCFIEASVGVGKRSTTKLANQQAGSKWNFQDILGFGVTLLQQKLDFRIQYAHYSNAGLARPNPGIEVIPMLTLSYNFIEI